MASAPIVYSISSTRVPDRLDHSRAVGGLSALTAYWQVWVASPSARRRRSLHTIASSSPLAATELRRGNVYQSVLPYFIYILARFLCRVRPAGRGRSQITADDGRMKRIVCLSLSLTSERSVGIMRSVRVVHASCVLKSAVWRAGRRGTVRLSLRVARYRYSGAAVSARRARHACRTRSRLPCARLPCTHAQMGPRRWCAKPCRVRNDAR